MKLTTLPAGAANQLFQYPERFVNHTKLFLAE
jgi:hypothetical protein